MKITIWVESENGEIKLKVYDVPTEEMAEEELGRLVRKYKILEEAQKKTDGEIPF